MCHLGAPQIARHMQASRKREINSTTIIIGDFNTPLIPMDTSTGKKISNESWAVNVLLYAICLYTYCSASGMAAGDTIE